MNTIPKYASLLILLVCLVGCDQVSKEVVREKISPFERITVIDNFLTLTKVENTGAFLSMGNTLPDTARLLVFIIFPCLLLLAATMYLLKATNLSSHAQTGIVLLIAGGIGNLIDRILYGSVTDFIHMDLVIFQTGVFNVADISIMSGFFLLVFTRIRQTPTNAVS